MPMLDIHMSMKQAVATSESGLGAAGQASQALAEVVPW